MCKDHRTGTRTEVVHEVLRILFRGCRLRQQHDNELIVIDYLLLLISGGRTPESRKYADTDRRASTLMPATHSSALWALSTHPQVLFSVGVLLSFRCNFFQ